MHMVDELNVKMVRALSGAGEAIRFSLKPLPRQLGRKYQDKFPEMRKALLALDPIAAAEKLLAEQPVRFNVEAKPCRFTQMRSKCSPRPRPD